MKKAYFLNVFTPTNTWTGDSTIAFIVRMMGCLQLQNFDKIFTYFIKMCTSLNIKPYSRITKRILILFFLLWCLIWLPSKIISNLILKNKLTLQKTNDLNMYCLRKRFSPVWVQNMDCREIKSSVYSAWVWFLIT